MNQEKTEFIFSDRSDKEAMLEMMDGFRVTQAIYVAAKLGIADLLEDGPKHCDELAAETNTKNDILYRLLRALASVGIFAETDDKYFQLTPRSVYLQSNVADSIKNLILLKGELIYQIWNNLFHSIKTGQTGCERLYGMELYEYCEQNPDAAKLFDAGMTAKTEVEKEAIIEAYDFSSIKTLVEVGGGEGKLLAAILKKNPNLTGILFDLPHVIEKANNLLEKNGVRERCELKKGDIFNSIPKGGNAYLMKHVIESWEDDRATVVLQNCNRAMNQGDILLICESVIPPGNAPSSTKFKDLGMLVFCERGKERTEEEYRQLLEQTGFKMESIIPTKENIDIIKGIKL